MKVKNLVDDMLIIKTQPVELIDCDNKCSTIFAGKFEDIPNIFKECEIEMFSTSMVIARSEVVKPALEIFIRYPEELED